MAGYVIHIAVGNVIRDKNKDLIKNNESEDFLRGIIMPDYKNYILRSNKNTPSGLIKKTHRMNMNKNLEDLSSYEMGYFIHLLTDHYFYKKFDTDIPLLNDYNLTNGELIEKYGVILPEKVKEFVKFTTGTPQVLNIDETCDFIEEMSNLDLKKEYEQLRHTKMNSQYDGELNMG